MHGVRRHKIFPILDNMLYVQSTYFIMEYLMWYRNLTIKQKHLHVYALYYVFSTVNDTYELFGRKACKFRNRIEATPTLSPENRT